MDAHHVGENWQGGSVQVERWDVGRGELVYAVDEDRVPLTESDLESPLGYGLWGLSKDEHRSLHSALNGLEIETPDGTTLKVNSSVMRDYYSSEDMLDAYLWVGRDTETTRGENNYIRVDAEELGDGSYDIDLTTEVGSFDASFLMTLLGGARETL